MSQFDYLSVMISIVLGVGMTELIGGAARLAQARDRVEVYAPTLFWAATLLLIFVQSWWAIFGMRDHDDWRFIEFAVVLVHPLGLSFLAMLVLPKIEGDSDHVIDLKANYDRQRPIFFSVLLLLVLVSVSRPLVFDGELRFGPDVGFHLVYVVMAVAGVFWKNPRFHQVIAPLVTLSMILYIAALFTELGHNRG